MMKQLLSYIGLLFGIVLVYVSRSLSEIFFFDYAGEEITTDPRIIGHRGAAALAPENTLASLAKALQANPEGIEIDVQQTRDGKIILMHDRTLDRTTNGNGYIKDIDVAVLKDLDAGSWFSDDFIGEKIPTLEEVIQYIDGRTTLIIDIKKGDTYYPDIVKNMISIIEAYNAEDWVIIQSFDTDILLQVHALHPEITLHKLLLGGLSFTNFIISNTLEYMNINKYPFIDAYSIHYAFANKRQIKHLQATGKKVFVWTVNDRQKMHALSVLGVDGIITDNPSLRTTNSGQ